MASIGKRVKKMRVWVNLYSFIRINRFSEAEIELPEDATVTDLLCKLPQITWSGVNQYEDKDMSKYILLTRHFIEMSQQMEQEYNRWYWQEQIPSKLAVKGVLRACRYCTVGTARPDAPRYMTIYEITGLEVSESYEWQITTIGSEWSKRLFHFAETTGVYEKIFPKDVDDTVSYPTAEYLYVNKMTPKPEGEKEFNHWYNEYHIPGLTTVPGVISGRRSKSVGKAYPYAPKYLAIYELENQAVIESDAWEKAGHDKMTIDVLSRTRIMRNLPGVYQLMLTPNYAVAMNETSISTQGVSYLPDVDSLISRRQRG
jgi:hypothetical protein